MTDVGNASAARIAKPGWYAHRFDPDRDLYHLIAASRAELRTATFLTDENLAGAAHPAPAPRGATMAAATRRAPVHFLFHSAFCCSTLLARALDIDGISVALREPVMLNDLMGWRQRGGRPAQVAEGLDHALRLLEQIAEPGESVLIKPSNLVNALAPAALALRPDARAILLHAPLETFLASIASKGLEGRLWVRDLWAKLIADGVDVFGFTGDELFRHSDLQVAALGWLAQQRGFVELAWRFGARVRTLSSETLLADRHSAVAAAARHYGWTLDDATVARIASGPEFQRNAKTGEPFGERQREAVHGAATAAHRDELDLVQRWARTVADTAAIPLLLPNPLLP